jgi:polysaccharide chain length determinant protein (PEP-CTERM system associated)
MGSSSAIANLGKLVLEQVVIVWRRKWLAVAGIWVACLVGWASVLMLPRSYESDARVFVDTSGVLTPLLKGIVLDNPSTQTGDYLRQALVSRPNMEEVVHATGLDANRTAAQTSALILAMANRVSVKAGGKNLFSISYTNGDPVMVRNVLQSLLATVARRVTDTSRTSIDKAHGFLDDQIAGYEKQLREADQRRAEFHKQYADYFPDPVTGRPKLQMLQQQMLQARQYYDSAVATRDGLSEQLKTVPQYKTVDVPTIGANGRISASPEVRVAQARADLVELQSKFTEQYPDVATARRHVQDLEAQTMAGSLGRRSVVPDTTHEQIRLRLVEAEAIIPPAKQRLDEAVAAYEQMKTASVDVPDVDAKVKDLDRDYDIIKKSYDDLVKTREAALISQAADQKIDRSGFVVVDPPQVPMLPSFPNLPLMFSLVLILGVGAGLALPIGLELMWGTYASASRLRVLGLPVAGVVTAIQRPESRRNLVLGAAGAMLALTGLFLTYGVLVTNSTQALGAR